MGRTPETTASSSCSTIDLVLLCSSLAWREVHRGITAECDLLQCGAPLVDQGLGREPRSETVLAQGGELAGMATVEPLESRFRCGGPYTMAPSLCCLLERLPRAAFGQEQFYVTDYPEYHHDCLIVAKRGHLETLQRARAQGCEWGPGTHRGAARCGRAHRDPRPSARPWLQVPPR